MIYKKSGSCEDLTEYDIAAKQRKQDIKARKINPYEPRKLLKGELPPHKPEPPCKIVDFYFTFTQSSVYLLSDFILHSNCKKIQFTYDFF